MVKDKKKAVHFHVEAGKGNVDKNRKNLGNEKRVHFSKIKKEIPLTLKDYEQQVTLENEGKFEDGNYLLQFVNFYLMNNSLLF